MQKEKHIKPISRKRGRPSKESIAKHGRPQIKARIAEEPTVGQKIKWCAELCADLTRLAALDGKRGAHRDARLLRALAKLSTYDATYGKGWAQQQAKCREPFAEYRRHQYVE